MHSDVHGPTDRQSREIEYHRTRAAQVEDCLLERPFSYEIISPVGRRWWNAYWEMYTFLMHRSVTSKRVLVLGCGFGEDAVCLSRLGAEVYAFDLSPESLELARKLAQREEQTIDFRTMPAERLDYDSDFFDFVVATDILHHVDIPAAMNEVVRVCRGDGIFIANEVYSHSLTNLVRHSAFVERHVVPTVRRIVYGGKEPYITPDERKLTQEDVRLVLNGLRQILMIRYYGWFVNRVISDRYKTINKIDRILLAALHPLAPLLGGRVLLAGVVAK